ncbi:MAG: FHA domain-containing protein [Acidimicrobiales bacterium]
MPCWLCSTCSSSGCCGRCGPRSAPPKPVLATAAPASPRQAARQARKIERQAAPVQLAIVAPPELRGRTFPLGDEVTVGRAAGCGVTLDDTYASQLHARVFSREGQLFVEDLGSTNGTYLNRQKVQGPQAMRRGDRLQVGNTVLELA